MKEKNIIYSESPYWVYQAPDKLFYGQVGLGMAINKCYGKE